MCGAPGIPLMRQQALKHVRGNATQQISELSQRFLDRRLTLGDDKTPKGPRSSHKTMPAAKNRMKCHISMDCLVLILTQFAVQLKQHSSMIMMTKLGVCLLRWAQDLGQLAYQPGVAARDVL